MGLPATKFYTIPEYLALEATTGQKHEYHDGVVTAMAGGSPAHSFVAGGILGELRNHLKGKPCKPFGSDLKVKAGGKVHYPDAAVVCPPMACDPDVTDAVTNPAVIFEVISDSTERYDRGAKFGFYRQNPDMTNYVLVSAERIYAEHYSRAEGDKWNLEFLGPGSLLNLPKVGCAIVIDAFYEGNEMLIAPLA